MDITIPLPQYSSVNTYKELMGYLKQLELAIHHAQKAVENAEQAGIEITGDNFILFEHSSLISSLKLDRKDEKNEEIKEFLENFEDNYFEELQNVELKIHLV